MLDVVVAAYFWGTEDSQRDKEVCGSQVLSRHDHEIFRLMGELLRNYIHHSYRLYEYVFKHT